MAKAIGVTEAGFGFCSSERPIGSTPATPVEFDATGG